MPENPFTGLFDDAPSAAVAPAATAPAAPSTPQISSGLQERLRKSMIKRKYKRYKGGSLTQREESMIDEGFKGATFSDYSQSPELLRFMGEETGQTEAIEKLIEATKLEKPSAEDLDAGLTWKKAQEAFLNHEGWTAPIARLAGGGMTIPAMIEERSAAPLWDTTKSAVGMALNPTGGTAPNAVVSEGISRVFNPAIQAIKAGAIKTGEDGLMAGMGEGGRAAKESFLRGKNIGDEAYDKLYSDLLEDMPDGFDKTVLESFAKAGSVAIDFLPIDPLMLAKPLRLGALARKAGLTGEVVDKMLAKAPEVLNALEDSIRAKVGAKVPERYTPEMLGQIDKAKREAGVFAGKMAADEANLAKQVEFNKRIMGEVEDQSAAVKAAADKAKAKSPLESPAMQELKARAAEKKASLGAPMTAATAQKDALRQRAAEKAMANKPVKDKAALLAKIKVEEEASRAAGGTRSIDEIADDLATSQLDNEKTAQYAYDLATREMYGPNPLPEIRPPMGFPAPMTVEQRLMGGLAKSEVPTPVMRRWNMNEPQPMKVVRPQGQTLKALESEADDAMDYMREETRASRSLLDDEVMPQPEFGAKPGTPRALPPPKFAPEAVKEAAQKRYMEGVAANEAAELAKNPKSIIEKWQKKAKDLIDNPKELGMEADRFAREISDVERMTGKAIDPITKSSIRERLVAANEIRRAASAAAVYEKTKLGNKLDKFLGAFGGKAWDDIIIGKAWNKLPRAVREAFVRSPEGATGEIAQIYREIADIKKAIVGEQLEQMTKVLTGEALGKKFTEEEKMYAWAISQGEKPTIPAALRGDDIRKAAAEARSVIDRVGEVFVKIVPEDARRMLSDETFLKNYGVYMPRYYKRFEMADVWERAANKYLAPAWRDKYLGHRTMERTLPEHMTEKYGIIKSPVVAARGALDLATDAFTHSFYRDLADDAAMTRFVPKGADAPAGMRSMPKNDKLGPLSSTDKMDAYVSEDVYWMLKDDLKEPSKGFLKFLGDANDFLMGYWKPAMTVLNPTSYAHNGWGALNMNAAGTGRIVGSPSMSKGFSTATRDLLSDADIVKQARADGVFKGNWAKQMSSQQKGAIQDALTALDKADGNVISFIKDLGKKVRAPYQSIDDINKLDIYKYGLEQGMGRREAALYARKWGIDWQRAGYAIKALGRGPVPFISYSALAIPRYLEASLKRPLATNAHGIAMAAVHKYAAEKWGLNDEDRATEEGILKGDWYAHRNLMRLPFGKPGQYADVSYIVPWNAFQTQGLKDQIFGSPYWSLVEAAWNKDLHTNREIYSKNDPDSIARQKVQTFLSRRWLPGIAPGGYFYERAKAVWNKTPDYLGQVKAASDFATEVAMGYRGVNVDYAKELERIKSEDKSRKSYLKGQMTKIDRLVREKRMTESAAKKDKVEFQNELDALERKKYPNAPLSSQKLDPAMEPQDMMSRLRYK